MNFDSLHLGFVFQMLVLCAIILVLAQIRLSDALGEVRREGPELWIFWLRRGAMFLKLLALCWTVVYSHQRNWQPWPPIAFFLFAFNCHVAFDLFVLRSDAIKMNRVNT
jgi:hypothetical protein